MWSAHEFILYLVTSQITPLALSLWACHLGNKIPSLTILRWFFLLPHAGAKCYQVPPTLFPEWLRNQPPLLRSWGVSYSLAYHTRLTSSLITPRNFSKIAVIISLHFLIEHSRLYLGRLRSFPQFLDEVVVKQILSAKHTQSQWFHMQN